jgi:proline dehydrogenase
VTNVGLVDTVRVYLPYGEAWYGYYLMRRTAERPDNPALLQRSSMPER